ncbi:hypothetical protein JCM10449v2_006442 [Rhodotorula kratochvilovae]
MHLSLTPHHAHHSLVPALTAFPASLPSSFSLDALRSWYTDARTDPLHPAIAFSIAASVLVWVLGELTGNVSQVDRLWTSLPLIYSAHFTFWPLVTGQVQHVADLDHRMLLVFALQCAWSARLTYQSARRGFLDPRSEDYRWPLVRKSMPTVAFKVLHLVFIAFIQNFLLLIAELPQYLLLTHAHSSSGHVSALAKLRPHHATTTRVELNVADAVLAVAFVVTLVLEMRADNQQQAFQRLKHAALDKQRRGLGLTAKEQSAVQRGFVAEGLWAWSRHPNFACEQTTWYLLYAFTVLPFLPLSHSITSHPLSTLRTLVTPAALLPASKRALAAAPSVSTLVTSLAHPLLALRAHAPALLSALRTPGAWRTLAARGKLHALIALRELRADEGTLWNYSVVAPLSMSALFFSSTILTERITGGKYPLYKLYRARVAKFWPPLTPLKRAWLALTGRRARVDRRIWGDREGMSAAKTLKRA